MTINATSIVATLAVDSDGNRRGVATTPPGGDLYYIASDGLSAGASILIKTNGAYNFGAVGPTVVLYDEFRGGVESATATMGATIGTWTAKSNSDFIYRTSGRDGGTCVSIYDRSATGTQRIRGKYVDFTTATAVFVCFSSKWINGYTGATSASTWPSVSHLKNIWVSCGRGGTGGVSSGDGNDIVLFSHNGGGASSFTGNDSQEVGWLGDGSDVPNHLFNSWNFHQAMVKGQTTTPTSMSNKPTLFASICNSATLAQVTITNKQVFSSSDAAIARCYVPGWFGNWTDYVNPDPLFDDIYIATGPGCCARVLLGNASTLTACRELWIVPPTAWGATEITARLPSTGASFSGKYLYIYDENNVLLNSTGLVL